MNARVARRVLAGGLWLDMVKPGWQELINWGELELTAVDMCVAGQVFADEAERLRADGASCAQGYDVLKITYGLRPDERATLGFSTDDLDDAGEGDPWHELHNAWLDLWGPGNF